MTPEQREQLTFLDGFAGGSVVRGWLEAIVRTRGYRTGVSLRDALDAAGIADANWRVERWLNLFRELGWLAKGAFSPTPEILFFGVGGMAGPTVASLAQKRPKYRNTGDLGPADTVSPVVFAWGIENPRRALPEDLVVWLNVAADC